MSPSDELTIPPELENLLKKAANAIVDAKALVALAGAGMGVDSGLPDFRGTEGFWRAYPPIAKLGLRFDEMADPSWFRRNPRLAWGFYGHRLNLYRATKPHAGFELIRSWNENCFVFTSNIDGHFQRAGFDSRRVVECHGSLGSLQCVKPCRDRLWPSDDLTIEVDEETLRASEPLPACPECGGLARPNVLMFGDPDWVRIRTDAQLERFYQWLESQRTETHLSEVVLVECGAGTAVPSVRFASENLVRAGATLIRINPREPEVPPGQIGLPLPALTALRALNDQITLG